MANYPDVSKLAAKADVEREGIEKRRVALERLRDAAIVFAPLWIEWAQHGSKEGTELATRTRVAREKMAGAAVDLFWAEKLP